MAQEQINSWLETLGIRYNIAQNGYICLGKLFGDAIIQWGISRLNSSYDVDINMNISISDILCAITTNCDNAISQAGVNIYIYNQIIKAHGTQTLGNDKFFWFALTK